MAIGAADPVLGEPVMLQLRTTIRGCPPPLVLADAGHFVQEWGDRVAPAGVEAFASVRDSSGQSGPGVLPDSRPM